MNTNVASRRFMPPSWISPRARRGHRESAPKLVARIDALRDLAGGLVRSVKSVKHIRKNVLRYTTCDAGTATELYDALRTEVAQVVVAIRNLDREAPDERSTLCLDQEAARLAAASGKRGLRGGRADPRGQARPHRRDLFPERCKLCRGRHGRASRGRPRLFRRARPRYRRSRGVARPRRGGDRRNHRTGGRAGKARTPPRPGPMPNCHNRRLASTGTKTAERQRWD